MCPWPAHDAAGIRKSSAEDHSFPVALTTGEEGIKGDFSIRRARRSECRGQAPDRTGLSEAGYVRLTSARDTSLSTL